MKFENIVLKNIFGPKGLWWLYKWGWDGLDVYHALGK